MMGKRGLYPILSKKGKKDQNIYDMMDILAYCDGDQDLLWIADKLNRSFLPCSLSSHRTNRKRHRYIRYINDC